MELEKESNSIWFKCKKEGRGYKKLINDERKTTKEALLSVGYKENGYLIIPLKKFNEILRRV